MTPPTLQHSDPAQMRIDLSEDGETLHPLAYFNAMAFMCFPSCEASRWQAVWVASDERARMEKATCANMSDVMSKIIMSASAKAGQRDVVGLMVLALIAAKAYGVNESQDACAVVVSEMVNNMPKRASVEYWLHAQGGSKTTRGRLRGDPKHILATFREYRAVAHLCATNYLAGPHAPQESLLLHHPKYAARFLATAAAFQREMSEIYATKGWRIWDIDGGTPSALNCIEHFDLFRGQFDDLFAPYLAR